MYVPVGKMGATAAPSDRVVPAEVRRKPGPDVPPVDPLTGPGQGTRHAATQGDGSWGRFF